MLARKRTAVVVVAALALIVGGAGAAFAATRGHAASKPSGKAGTRQGQTAAPRAHHGRGNCPNMGTTYRPSSPEM